VTNTTAILESSDKSLQSVAAVSLAPEILRVWTLSLSRDEWEAVGLVLVVKLMVFWQAAIRYEIQYNRWISSLAQALDPVAHWDVDQYLNIATLGYGPTGDARLRLAFFPLYPWLVRALLPIVHNPLVGALTVSTVASLALPVLLFRLVRIDYGTHMAWQAVWFLAIFPTSYFLHVPYTESLFLTFLIGSVLACRVGNWLLAGILGGLATLTHDTGILLVAALGYEAMLQFRTTHRWQNHYLWLGLIPLGFGVFLALNHHITGSVLAFMAVKHQQWSNGLSTPLAFYNQLGVLGWMRPADAEMIGIQIFFYVLASGIATCISLWLLRPSYAIWMLANWVVIACLTWDLSAPRYVLAMFPIFILEALASRNRLVHAALTACSLLFLALFSGEFALGHWAF
jgi:Dolichyl-phosphate-mannose-protein mannosyltransferase